MKNFYKLLTKLDYGMLLSLTAVIIIGFLCWTAQQPVKGQPTYCGS